MTIPNMFHKVKIHFFLYVAMLLCIVTGYFKECIIFMAFICVHELGHIICALFYHWNIEKIILLPFGGLTIFHEKINRPIKEEGIIVVGGIIFQTIFYLIISFFIEEESLSLIHYGIIFFNLLPIYPLDGAKIFNIACNILFPFKKSHIFTIFISLITLLFFIVLNYQTLLLVLVSLFLFIGLLKEMKQHKFLYHKFLLERYLYPVRYNKIKEIRGMKLQKMKRDYKHQFWIGCKRESETKILQELFDNRE